MGNAKYYAQARNIETTNQLIAELKELGNRFPYNQEVQSVISRSGIR